MPQRITLALLVTLVVLAGIAVVLLARHDGGNSSGNSSTPSKTLQGSHTIKGSGVETSQTRDVRRSQGSTSPVRTTSPSTSAAHRGSSSTPMTPYSDVSPPSYAMATS